jgi:SAM-dependent methyltransferase
MTIWWPHAGLRGDGPVRVLAIGCGDADEVGAWLATGRVREVVGVDLDEEAVQRARARWPQATFLCADAAQLPDDFWHRFDVVLIRRPDLLAQPDRWRAVFAAIPSYLRPAGRVVVVVLGVAEEVLARRWLHAAGPQVRPADPAGDERVLVAEVGSPLLVWEGDREAQACQQGEICG